MVEVVKIGRAKPDPHIVDAVKQLLKDAESGDLRTLVFIGKSTDGSYQHYVGGDDKLDTLAQLSRLQHRINITLDIDTEAKPYDFEETTDDPS